MTEQLKAKLLSNRVEHPGSMITPCWLWTAAKNDKGYGIVKREGTCWRVSRLAYKVFVGPFDEALNILHKCDTPSCFNPEHLYPGTQQDNAEDRYRRSRDPSRIGADNSRAILNESKVLEIARLLQEGYPQAYIAEQFRVSPSCISNISTGKTWSHITELTVKGMVNAT
jgi:hypothetical protein